MRSSVILPEYSHYRGLPPPDMLFNPLIDIRKEHKEKDELTEFYKLSNEYCSPEFGIKYLLNLNLFPFQMATIRAILKHKFPMIIFTRGGGKTFLLAVYSIYHAIMFPGSKIVLVSASFRQSKYIFDEVERIYKSSPLLRAISDRPPTREPDRCKYKVNDSTITALPLGTGSKIRGERGHVILADEFNSIPIDTFDIVVRGFAAVQADPWRKAREMTIKRMEIQNMQDGIPDDKAMSEFMLADGNKLILSGTAGFKNGTLYKLYSQYSRIIGNKVLGNAAEYSDIFEEELDEQHKIDYRDYCILKFTYKDLPCDLMETKMIDNARATMPKILFNSEYMCKFADDTFGFFKMRDIINATANFKDGFTILTRGSPNRQFVLGVDVARFVDRFAICVVELGSPNKVRYVWTSQGQKYSHSAKQVRNIMKKFNVVGIAIDAGGGGTAIEEVLNSSDVMGDGEEKLYRFDDESIDAQKGSKMLYMFDFHTNWIEEANALLQKNLEDRVIMFPSSARNEFSNDVDDAIFEINEMKRELVAIEVSHTKTGKKHFDLSPPDLKKGETNVKHKDRYSALLLANFLASRLSVLGADPNAQARDLYYQGIKQCGWAS